MGVIRSIYPNSNRPLYLQLRDILVEQIEIGELEAGESIPGERILAEQYGVSRVTVRKSIGSMVEDGYLIRAHGKETTVANRKMNHHLGLLIGVAEELASVQAEVTGKSVFSGYQQMNSNVNSRLHLPEDSEVFGFHRVLYVEEQPYVINYSYVPAHIGKILENLDFNTAKVFSLLEQCGYKLSYGEQTITAGLCRKEEAEHLDYKVGNAVLVMKRTTYLESGEPILYEKSIFRGDVYQYSVRLNRKL